MKYLIPLALVVAVLVATATAHAARQGNCIALATATDPSPTGGHVYAYQHGACPAQMVVQHYKLKLQMRDGDRWRNVATSVDAPTVVVDCQPLAEYRAKVTLTASEPGGGALEVDTDTSRHMFCGAAS